MLQVQNSLDLSRHHKLWPLIIFTLDRKYSCRWYTKICGSKSCFFLKSVVASVEDNSKQYHAILSFKDISRLKLNKLKLKFWKWCRQDWTNRHLFIYLYVRFPIIYITRLWTGWQFSSHKFHNIIHQIGWSYYAFMIAYGGRIENLTTRIIVSILYHIILLLFLWSYLMAIFTQPGRPPPQYYLTGI